MITATRRLQFAAGHRIPRHESKCRHLHGHNYVVLITAHAEELDTRGRIIDFGVIKERFGSWIERNWDHGFILWEGDHEAIAAIRHCPGYKLFLMPWSPTAENMAQFLLQMGEELLPKNWPAVSVTKVRVWETENCYADVIKGE